MRSQKTEGIGTDEANESVYLNAAYGSFIYALLGLLPWRD